MWADHAVFCPEFQGLLSQACLLTELNTNDCVVVLNDTPFHITTPSYGVPAITGKTSQTIMVKLFDGEPTKSKGTHRDWQFPAGVRPMLTDNGLVIEDLWLEHEHLKVFQNRLGGMTMHGQRLSKSKPWKVVGRDDYLGTQEYDMQVGDLARSLKPKLAEAARLRIEGKREAARLAAAQEAAEHKAFLDSIHVARADLGEDNGTWGMF